MGDSNGRRMKISATVKLKRFPDVWMDRNRLYRVLIDDTQVGELWPLETGSFFVSPGVHRVRVKIDFLRSNELVVDVGVGETVSVACRGQGSAMAVFNTFFRWNSYLTISVMDLLDGEEEGDSLPKDPSN